MLCIASNSFRFLAYLAFCFFRYMPAYSIIFNVIKAYSRILRHCEGIFRFIQAYSVPSVTLASSQPWHILGYLEPEANLKPCETLTRHIPNLGICNYSAIFRHIHNLRQCWHMQKRGILRIQEYSEHFYNYIPTQL